MESNRNPEEFLRRIKEEEEQNETQNGKGRFENLSWLCAGVGKTYHMLEETRQVLKAG